MTAKHTITILLASVLLSPITGCSNESPVEPAADSEDPAAVETVEEVIPEAAPLQTLSLADGAVTVEVPADWASNPNEHPFDEQYLSADRSTGTGIRIGQKSALPSGATPKDDYLRSIEILTSAQPDYTELTPEAVESLEDKTITTTTYTGNIQGRTAYYKFALIEFAAETDFYVVMVQGGAPTDWEAAEELLNEINRSAAITL